MFNAVCKSLLRTFLKKGGIFVCLFIAALFTYSTADAKICVLPGGQCSGDDPGPGVDSDPCDGYNLDREKCTDSEGNHEACYVGWDCSSCTNASGTHYKCTAKEPPAGYEPGLEECTTPCQLYTFNGFSGNKINGKCTPISGYTTQDPGDCYTYTMPDYVYKVNISGASVTEVTRHNCYFNEQKMMDSSVTPAEQWSTTQPPSCTTYNSQLDGLGGTDPTHEDTMCYSHGHSIGTNYSTEERDEDVFIVKTEYGKNNGENTEPCYIATGCNVANGWLPYDEVDSNVFVYSERSSDGIVCRKANACVGDNNWYDYNDLGKYKNIYFTTEETTRSGQTCYRATGCYTAKAYTSEPDSTYFKFSKKTSNDKNCWIVTGMADYAYASEEEPKHFTYENKSANQFNSETGEFEDVTYYRVKECMPYAYPSQPDATYFTYNSKTKKKLGTVANITCWNVTGKAANAYNADDRFLTYFDYDDATAYLNGTKTEVTYYRATQCMQYAYSSEPDAKHFSYTSKTQKKLGTVTDITCWNVTGKGEYAYTAEEKINTHFAYDTGATAHLHGTEETGTYYNILSCGSNAYASQPNAVYFKSDSKSGKQGGVNTNITCWNATECSSYSYTSQPDARYFTFDSSTNKEKGTDDDLTCWHATGKAANAYESQQDTSYFKSSSATAYKNGTSETMTYWIVDSCGTYAYNEAQDTSYFANDSATRKENGSTNNITCYRVTGCGGNAYASQPNTTYFKSDSDKRKKNGTTTEVTCWRAKECSTYSYTSQPDARYFTSDSSTLKRLGTNDDITS